MLVFIHVLSVCVYIHLLEGGGGGGGVDLGSFSSSFIASMLYIRFSCIIIVVYTTSGCRATVTRPLLSVATAYISLSGSHSCSSDSLISHSMWRYMYVCFGHAV